MKSSVLSRPPPPHLSLCFIQDDVEQRFQLEAVFGVRKTTCPGFDPSPEIHQAEQLRPSRQEQIRLRLCCWGGSGVLPSDLRLTASTFPSAQHQSCCDRILFGCHWALWRLICSSQRARCEQASHFVNSSHILCVVAELLTVTLAGPSPALLSRLQGGGQAQLSAALGAHCSDKPGGLEAQLKLGQRGLASPLRW